MAQKYTQFGHYTLYKRGNRWHCCYYEGHKRVRKSTGKAKKSEALEIISQLMEAKGNPIKPSGNAQSPIPFGKRTLEFNGGWRKERL